MGALRPNTAVIGYKQNWKQCSLQQVEEYEQLLFDVMVSGARSEQQPQVSRVVTPSSDGCFERVTACRPGPLCRA